MVYLLLLFVLFWCLRIFLLKVFSSYAFSNFNSAVVHQINFFYRITLSIDLGVLLVHPPQLIEIVSKFVYNIFSKQFKLLRDERNNKLLFINFILKYLFIDTFRQSKHMTLFVRQNEVSLTPLIYQTRVWQILALLIMVNAMIKENFARFVEGIS